MFNMKVPNRSVVFLLLLFAAKTAYTDTVSSGKHDSSEDDPKLEELCGSSGSNTLVLGKLETSSLYYTVGEEKQRLDECYIDVESRSSEYGIVIVVEKYNTEVEGALTRSASSEDCTSTVKVSYNKDGQDQESSMCFNSQTSSNTKSDRSSQEDVDIEYIVFSTIGQKMQFYISNDGEEKYGGVFTAVKIGTECEEEESPCVEKDQYNDFRPHCIWKPLMCDGHVHCAVTPEPTDELGCSNQNTTFSGVNGDQYLYLVGWSSSVLLFALIVVPVIGLVVVGMVLIFICMRKMVKRRQHQNYVARGADHVNVIAVPDWDKDEKQSKPPDYSSIEELPPAYHSLFLPTSNTMHSQESEEKPKASNVDPAVGFSSETEDKPMEYQYAKA